MKFQIVPETPQGLCPLECAEAENIWEAAAEAGLRCRPNAARTAA
jgi:hypothetical protein